MAVAHLVPNAFGLSTFGPKRQMDPTHLVPPGHLVPNSTVVKYPRRSLRKNSPKNIWSILTNGPQHNLVPNGISYNYFLTIFGYKSISVMCFLGTGTIWTKCVGDQMFRELTALGTKCEGPKVLRQNVSQLFWYLTGRNRDNTLIETAW